MYLSCLGSCQHTLWCGSMAAQALRGGSDQESPAAELYVGISNHHRSATTPPVRLARLPGLCLVVIISAWD